MKTIVVCIGNPEGGDDALGPYVAQQLIPHQTENFIVINTETTPENYTGVIKQYQPQRIIIIDAVDMALPPGEIRIIPQQKLGNMHISTHGIPLSVYISYLSQYCKKIMFIGVQPKTMQGPMSSIVKKTTNKLQNLLLQDTLQSIPEI